MAEILRSALFGKLNSLGYKSAEAATVLCKKRGNPYVELVHWVHGMAQLPDSDFHRIIQHFGLNRARLDEDITAALDRLPRGASAISDFSSHLEEAVERGWIYATLLLGESQVRTGHLVIGLLKTPGLRNVFLAISSQLAEIKVEALTDDFYKITAGSPEEQAAAQEGSATGGGVAPGVASAAVASPAARQDALARFSVDLTERARKGEIDPIVGRDEEIRQVTDILMRRRQNNPVLVGEAGVGKTAVVEGFALRLIAGDVPPLLKDVTLRTLDVGMLQAGASMKGEFEQRLRSVIDEVQRSPKPIILFIDEVHTLIGAGGAAGTGDAANLLKPALARGTLRTIAATTWDEHRKYIEKDPALSRRFEKIFIEEPSEAKAVLMVRSAVAPLENHHRVQILNEAIEAAVRLSKRYIPSRQLPDKAVSLMDTACARVAVSQHAVPARVEDVRRRIEWLQSELEIIQREARMGIDQNDRAAELTESLAKQKTALAELELRWNEEKKLVQELLGLRSKLRDLGVSTPANAKPAPLPGEPPATPQAALTDEEREAMLGALKKLQTKLAEFQGESPLLFPSVDQSAVASVVADWTGIPVGRMARQSIRQVLDLSDQLERRVVGQRHALDLVTRRLQTSRAKLENPNKPIGVFLFVGPSGTGKTETALALAEALYGTEQNLVTINMSEYQEKHTVSGLKGSPPGYVGYGEGGILTEAVRRRPYSVVLLDEVEKAHPEVNDIFFQVFDKGWMKDSEGRFIDFRNTVVILTSNAAQDTIVNLCKDPALLPTAEGLEKALRVPLTKVFRDALLNRLTVVPFFPISADILDRIIRLQLSRVGQRLRDNHNLPFTYDASVPELVARRCAELERGARVVDALITNTILPEIGREFLTRMMEGKPPQKVHVSVQDSTFAYTFE